MLENLKLERKITIYCISLSLFFILALWNFWELGVSALGINAFVFFSIFLWLVKNCTSKNNIYWLIPLGLICLNYLIYDNPYIKAVNFLVIPISLSIFIAGDKYPHTWSITFIVKRFIKGLFVSFEKIARSFGLHFSFLKKVSKVSKKTNSLYFKIAKGLVIAVIILTFIVIPLLSSADKEFANSIHYLDIYLIQPILDIFAEHIFAKISFFCILTIYLSSQMLSWEERKKKLMICKLTRSLIQLSQELCYQAF